MSGCTSCHPARVWQMATCRKRPTSTSTQSTTKCSQLDSMAAKCRFQKENILGKVSLCRLQSFCMNVVSFFNAGTVCMQVVNTDTGCDVSISSRGTFQFPNPIKYSVKSSQVWLSLLSPEVWMWTCFGPYIVAKFGQVLGTVKQRPIVSENWPLLAALEVASGHSWPP